MLKNLWSEFKAFAFKGNMIELAVAVVIGAAFGKVINSLVDDVIMPTVGYVKHETVAAANAAADTAKKAASMTGLATSQPTSKPMGTTTVAATGSTTGGDKPVVDKTDAGKTADAKPQNPDDVNIDLKIGPANVGKFIGALINFVIVAAAVFLMVVKLMGSVMKKVAGSTPAPSEPTTKECPECLSVIPLKAKRCPNCTSVLAPA